MRFWMAVRTLLAFDGLVLVAFALTTLLGWFSFSVDGDEVAWYWLMGAGFLLGAIGLFIDQRVAPVVVVPREDDFDPYDRRTQELEAEEAHRRRMERLAAESEQDPAPPEERGPHSAD
jgi:hypothetical protein